MVIGSDKTKRTSHVWSPVADKRRQSMRKPNLVKDRIRFFNSISTDFKVTLVITRWQNMASHFVTSKKISRMLDNEIQLDNCSEQHQSTETELQSEEFISKESVCFYTAIRGLIRLDSRDMSWNFVHELNKFKDRIQRWKKNSVWRTETLRLRRYNKSNDQIQRNCYR